MQIRRVSGSAEFSRLVEIWRSAVDATHDFLRRDDVVELQSQLETNYLPRAEIFVAEIDGVPMGFAGINDTNLEMLFVHADVLYQGIGTALLEFVVQNYGVRFVDVNEQNEQARQFYLSRGFMVISCSPVDDQGRPYPILHMEETARKG